MGYFGSDNIFNTYNTNKGVSTFLNIIKAFSFLDVIVLWPSLIWLKISVSERYGSQGLTSIDYDCLKEALFNAIS
jgi:hypothetical protein